MVVGVIAVTAVVFAIAPGLAQAGTLDQQQTSGANGYNIYPPYSQAQTFTAGITGALDRVDLHLKQGGAENAPLTVQIRNAPGGFVGETVLTSRSVGGVGTDPSGSLVPIVFGSPPPVVAGTPYAIVVYSTTSVGYYNWGFSDVDPYPLGRVTESTDPFPASGASFTNVGHVGEDFAFRTYVAPPTAATPTGERAAALKKCKKKNSKKARKKCKKKAAKLPV
jgi:hypothetical protein